MSDIPKNLSGVQLQRNGDCAICHIEMISDDLKELIRKNLTSICHGSYINDHSNILFLGYKNTLKSFLETYKTKSSSTQIGMIGEFLAHILIPYYFNDFEVASPFLNLEEKSIKKGFDFLLFKSSNPSLWITEVKSGNIHKNKDHDGTTNDLLKLAKSDLVKRLGLQDSNIWRNALNSVRASVSDKKITKIRYKK